MKLRVLALTAAALAASTTTASAEGKLNIYNWGNYTSPELIEQFEKAYDVELDHRRLT